MHSIGYMAYKFLYIRSVSRNIVGDIPRSGQSVHDGNASYQILDGSLFLHRGDGGHDSSNFFPNIPICV